MRSASPHPFLSKAYFDVHNRSPVVQLVGLGGMLALVPNVPSEPTIDPSDFALLVDFSCSSYASVLCRGDNACQCLPSCSSEQAAQACFLAHERYVKRQALLVALEMTDEEVRQAYLALFAMSPDRDDSVLPCALDMCQCDASCKPTTTTSTSVCVPQTHRGEGNTGYHSLPISQQVSVMLLRFLLNISGDRTISVTPLATLQPATLNSAIGGRYVLPVSERVVPDVDESDSETDDNMCQTP
jgi:hypothetical protein